MDNIYELVDLYRDTLCKRGLFEGEILEQIKRYYRVALTWSSNALEGNSLTELETKILLDVPIIFPRSGPAGRPRTG